MDAIDILTYKILIGPTSWDACNTGYFLGGTINNAMNEVPTSNLNFRNDAGYFSTGTQLTSGAIIVVSASINGGNNYFRLFSGTVGETNAGLTPSGEETFRVACYGADRLRLSHVSPNQVLMGPCDIGAVFTGSSTDRMGLPWESDDKGNYPNGLLYAMGYTLSAFSVKNMWETVSDIPGSLKLSQKTIFDAMKDTADSYGLVFYFDDFLNTFNIISDSCLAYFPTSSLTLSKGNEINNLEVRKTILDNSDKLLLIGQSPDLFFMRGSGPYPWSWGGGGNKEIIENASNISDADLLIKLGIQKHKLYTSSTIQIEITSIPITESVLGKRITLIDPERGINQYGNVVGTQYNIYTDRLETTLDIESSKKNQGKILAEILKELENKQKQNTDSADVYLLCQGYPTGNWNEPNMQWHVTAIGYGSGTHAWYDYGPMSLSCIKPIASCDEPYVYVPGNPYDPWVNYYYWGSFGPNDPKCRIREIILFGRETTASLVDVLYTMSEIYEPTEWSTNSFPIYTSSQNWPVQINKIYLKDSIYREVSFNPMSSNRFLFLTGSVYWGSPPAPPKPDATDWVTSRDFSGEEKKVLSKYYSWSVPLTLSGANNVGIILFETNIGMVTGSKQCLHTLRGDHDVSFSANITYSLYIFDYTNNVWDERVTTVAIVTNAQWWYGYADTPNYVSEAGVISTALAFKVPSEGTVELYPTHFHLGVILDKTRAFSVREITVIEKALWISNQNTFRLSQPAQDILGFYISASQKFDGTFQGAGANFFNYNFRKTGQDGLSWTFDKGALYGAYFNTAVGRQWQQLTPLSGKYINYDPSDPNNNRCIVDILNEQGYIYVEYSTKQRTNFTLPDIHVLSPDAYTLSYSVASMKDAVVHIIPNEYAPYTGATMTVDMSVVGPSSYAGVVGCFLPGGNRISSSGIAKDSTQNIYVLTNLVYASCIGYEYGIWGKYDIHTFSALGGT